LFCPNCHAEYVPGFTRCADCGVELVERLPESEARSKAEYVAPPPPDVTAFSSGGHSSNPIARLPLLWFLLLPPLIYLVPVLQPRFRWADSYPVLTALVALLVGWAIGQQRDGPRRVIQRLALFLIVAAGYELALLLLLKPTFAYQPGVLAQETLPVAVVAALLVQNLLSPNTALRALAQPLRHWHARWFIWVIGLLAWPLLALLVVGLSRLLASTEHGSGLEWWFVVRLALASPLSLAPWALAWFGYGVPVLLHRMSALAVGLLLGSLSWLSTAIPWFVHGRGGMPDLYLNLGSDLALAIVAVWLFQRGRGSIWPVLVLLATGESSVLLINWAGNGFGRWYDSTWTALVVAEAAFAAALVIVGRMWRAPRKEGFGGTHASQVAVWPGVD
jgi:hypothetical protein